MKLLFSGITATARAEVEMQFERARQVLFSHHISGSPANGGYISLRLREMTVADALTKKTPVTIVTASRAANVVTVAATAHGLSVGDLAIIRNVRYDGATDFNGEFVVVTVADADTFTYAQTAAGDTTGAGGRVYAVKQVPLYTDGANIKTAATTTSYACTYTGIKGVLEITCNITNGTHTVWMDDVEGSGAGNVGDLAIGAVEVKDNDTDNRLEVDANGAARVNLRNAAGTEIATAGAPARVDPTGTTAQPVTDNAGSLTVDQAAHDSLNANANLQVGNADVGVGNPVPVSDNATTLSVDDGAGTLTVDSASHDSMPVNANLLVGDADVGVANPVPVSDNGTTLSVDDGAGTLTVDQATHDNLNANANLQVGNADVGVANPVPVSDNGGALTVDGTVTVQDGAGSLTVDSASHDTFPVNANLQVGDADVGVANPVPVSDNGATLSVDDGAGALSVDDNGGSLTVDGSVTALPTYGALSDGSGAIVAGDVSEEVFAANASRKYFFFQNISDTEMWINFGVAAVKDQPSIRVSTGESFEMSGPFVSNQAINVICVTISKKYTAKEG